LILTTQRGDDRLAERLELLNLELTILSEKKVAKVVALLEGSFVTIVRTFAVG
jgi:hypothetical protein